MNAPRRLLFLLIALPLALAGCTGAPPTVETAPPAATTTPDHTRAAEVPATPPAQPKPAHVTTPEPAPPPPPPPPLPSPPIPPPYKPLVVSPAAPPPPHAVAMQPAAGAPFATASRMVAPWSAPTPVDRENYQHYSDNPIHVTQADPVSTFGIDVDTASYTNVRRMLEQGSLPPPDAVRAEEFINYFDYAYTPPAERAQPFSVTTEVAPAPWNAHRQLLLVGIQGYRVPADELPDANLVFLIDTSGSMASPDKLPLLKATLKQLVPQLGRRDHVAIVAYAGQAGVVLASTPGDEHARILAAIDSLNASGSTNGQAGLELAYAEATRGFIAHGINRVILATDGDFNVGQTDIDALKGEIAEKRRSGIALTTLGLGQGNYNDAMAVALADIGNGNHYYIDKLSEGRRVLVEQLSSTVLTIARDVKIQVEFNPERVQTWRLIGYVKRNLQRTDFNNDHVDSGDLGAGANVTALYEITPAGSPDAAVDPLRYGGDEAATPPRGHDNELAYVRLRYKLPEQSRSQLVERPVTLADVHAQASTRLRFAAAVAAFAEALRGGDHLDGYSLGQIATLARAARGTDPDGSRADFVRLVDLARSLRTPVPDTSNRVGLR
ncbi:MAG TPA: VWA domain-containing protein [Rhodanobacteraceae bacterium]|nr:VWA domain-containing protein [Rhodanobacteraceae bacterium]